MFGKLRVQLLSIFLIFGLINIFIIFLYSFGSKRKNQIEKIEDRLHNIELLIYKDAQQINNFFTYETKRSNYFDTHNSYFLEQHQTFIVQVKTELEELRLTNEFFIRNNSNKISTICHNLDSMVTATDSIMNLIYFRGFKDYGIEGDMRNHAHALEEIKGVDLTDLLMLRRHEKDYIIRNEEKYIVQFQERMAQMKANYTTNKSLSPEEKKRIDTELYLYQESFIKMIEIDRLIGIKDNTALKAKLDSIINTLVIDSENLNNYCNDYKLRAYRNIRNISILLLMGIIAVSVILSIKLSKRVTKRVSLLSVNISDFISSGFAKFELIQSNKRDDEVGLLIKNFELLKLKIHDQLNYLEVKVQERTEEINIQKEYILSQNKRFMDSLRSALSIQEAMLPDKSYIGETFPEHFIFFRPKDLVSGDFYWFKRIQNQEMDISVIAIVDCTGHGVPGAFMSMLGIALLNDIIIKKDVNTSAHILNKLRKNVINTLAHHNNAVKVNDGMDVAVTIVDHGQKKLQYSGANRNLVRIRNNKLEIIKGDKMCIGKSIKEDVDFSFTELDYADNDIIYMFTDGFADQFGGPNNNKYLRRKLLNFLLGISHYSMDVQKQSIDSELNGWMKNADQTDDILVTGFKLNY
ncbi:MAG: SpoIIE family protein phosphatase [Salinivirgaceae bacterium]